MKRLDFKLPDFTRIVWVSDKASRTWRPILDAIVKAWLEIEWLSVAEGVRSCCLVSVTPEQFLQKGAQWAECGLNSLPLAIQGISNYTYSSVPSAVKPGEAFVFRLVVGKPERTIEFKRAWDSGDDKSMGRLLGYPDCCMDFYRENWVRHGLVDTTWPMAKKDSVHLEERTEGNKTTVASAEGPPEANILWRWMGVRAVPHLPCGFSCDSTVKFGKEMMHVGRKAGFAEEMDRMTEILSWPVEWSALHGIAVIKTPVLKVSTLTDASAYEYVVRRNGTGYPPEGAKGLHFPYSRNKRTESQAYRASTGSAPSAGKASEDLPDWYWMDNGFAGLPAMDEAHQPIVKQVSSLPLGILGNVLDLGCGNGALLKKILFHRSGLAPYGIDLSSEGILHAGVLLPDFSLNFKVADMFENPEAVLGEREFSLAVVMPGRFLETDEKKAARLRNLLRKNCENLLLYAYGDWLKRYGSLSKLAANAGFAMLDSDASANAGFAVVNPTG